MDALRRCLLVGSAKGLRKEFHSKERGSFFGVVDKGNGLMVAQSSGFYCGLSYDDVVDETLRNQPKAPVSMPT
jgi:hypothetical protein